MNSERGAANDAGGSLEKGADEGARRAAALGTGPHRVKARPVAKLVLPLITIACGLTYRVSKSWAGLFSLAPNL